MKPLALLSAALLALTGCNDEITGLEPPSDPATETFAASLGVDISAMSRTPEGVYFLDQAEGTGAEITSKTDSVFVTYAGYLKDGKLFDSGTNVRFVLGQLLPGFRSGLTGMKQGGKRKLVIPSELGYGRTTIRNPDGSTKIPRQSTLVFDVEVIAVHNPSTPST
jgi:FKBP-type peptidyl-prolyl cis-trans isomerase FkpA